MQYWVHKFLWTLNDGHLRTEKYKLLGISPRPSVFVGLIKLIRFLAKSGLPRNYIL